MAKEIIRRSREKGSAGEEIIKEGRRREGNEGGGMKGGLMSAVLVWTCD